MGKCYFNPEWLLKPEFSKWLAEEPSGDKNKFVCKFCDQAYLVGQSGLKALTSHMLTQKHVRAQGIRSGTKSILSFAKAKVPSHESASATTPASATAIQSSLNLKVTDNHTLEAEVRWALHNVSKHISARSSDNIGNLFQIMFPDSQIAMTFQCGRTKLGYLATFGIAPAIKSSISAALGEAKHYVLMFDESLNFDLQKKQLDVHVRFVDSTGLVTTKYLDSFFMGHAKATDILSKISQIIDQVGSNKLLQLSMDGPNVNWRVFKDLSSHIQDKTNNTLLNIGSCGLHIVHNSFKCGADGSGWGIANVLNSLYYLFKESPARREDFVKTTESSKLPLKFCGHRWLENIPAAERAIEIWPAMLKYFDAVKKGKINEPTCKSFKHLLDKESDQLLLAKLHCFIFIAKILRPFLIRFQSNEPLAPFISMELFKVVKRLYSLVLKADYMETLKTPSDLALKEIPKEAFLSEQNFNLGHQAEMLLEKERSKVSLLQLKAFRQSFLNFVKLCVTKIICKSPLKYEFATEISCFNPEVIQGDRKTAKDLFKRMAKHLEACKWITPQNVDEASFQYDTLLDHLAPFQFVGRLDQYLLEYGGLKELPELYSVVNIILILSHGNADVERGFSVNKEVSVENMLEESLISRRLICQYVRDNGTCAADVPVSKEMLISASKAWHRYSEALETKKKEREMEQQSSTRKRKMAELKELKSKKRRVELDIDTLTKSADELNEKAELANAKQAHELIVKSNAMRRNAKEKRLQLGTLSSLITEKEGECSSL